MMKGRHTVFQKKSRRGMTLIEVVIFMFLTFFVLKSSFPLLTRLRYADRAHAERLAAINLANRTYEKLLQTPPSRETAPAGYKKIKQGTTIYYSKIYASTNFYKNSTLNLQVRLYPESSSTLGDYYKGEIRMRWNSKLSPKKTKSQTETITVLLFQDV